MDSTLKGNITRAWFFSLSHQIERCKRALGKECGLDESINQSIRKSMLFGVWNYLNMYLISLKPKMKECPRCKFEMESTFDSVFRNNEKVWTFRHCPQCKYILIIEIAANN